MKIVLLEEKSGVGKEHVFVRESVTFGRDSSECSLSFSGAEFPMVSRSHAEIRFRDGFWYLIDRNSSYGTFLNGLKIERPSPLAMGDRIQFGTDGPVLRVIGIETPEITFRDEPSERPAENRRQAQAVLRFEDGRADFPLTANSVWLGRDPAADVVFDPEAVMVSRRHAEIRTTGGEFRLFDNNSFNGTFVNGQRLAAPIQIFDGDVIQLGLGGPKIILSAPKQTAPKGLESPAQRLSVASSAGGDPKTVVAGLNVRPRMEQTLDTAPQLMFTAAFGSHGSLIIGRDASNDIVLEGLQISKKHARLILSGGQMVIEDLGSTNGTYVNGVRITKQILGPNDSVGIGSFLLRPEPDGRIGVYDTRAKTRITAINLSKRVKNRFGGGDLILLDDISLTIGPNEFVGILGPSGSGKSTLMDALSGFRPAQRGNILINNLDLYRHLDSFKQSIGYVPQDDIIHRELSVYRTLFYIARLRLSRDAARSELDQIVNEVLDVTGLSERRNVPVSQLSGGQRKRVSTAVELITKPSIIFLDEPTSGLDPATEDKIMRLFRQIAESGRTVIMTTHAMENVRLFDKVIILMRGKLAFFGRPEEALSYFGVSDFNKLFDKLEAPSANSSVNGRDVQIPQKVEAVADGWKQKYLTSPLFDKYIRKSIADTGSLPPSRPQKKRRLGLIGAFNQWITLSRRYFEVLLKDKLTLFILLAQAPAIAFLTFLAVGSRQPRDFLYFVVALVAFWFGTSVAAREIVREKPIYRRERMVNLGILPYLGSKLLILGIIVAFQCILLFVPLKLFDFIGLNPMPGDLLGLPQFWIMLLTAAVGIAAGLLVSSIVRTSEMATGLVPLILIPQILLSGIVGVPAGAGRVAGMIMPAAWSFDAIKRFSSLDTLQPEGADPRGKTKGLGLFKSIEKENDAAIEKFRDDMEEFKKAARAYMSDPLNNPTPIEPEIGELKKIPEDLSKFVTFLHPWMNEILDQIVLIAMFAVLTIATAVILKLKDFI
jgi:ABC-type multidrug transport system ATPase subunit/pSer/pThr/pTyr-binding forkhead associated (FHA) protein